MGSDGDISTLVRAALACGGGASTQDDGAPEQLARKALVQLGFAQAVAAHAVEQAAAHVGTDVDLPLWLKRRCAGADDAVIRRVLSSFTW